MGLAEYFDMEPGSINRGLQDASPLLMAMGMHLLTPPNRRDPSMPMQGLAGMMQMREARQEQAQQQAMQEAMQQALPALQASGRMPEGLAGLIGAMPAEKAAPLLADFFAPRDPSGRFKVVQGVGLVDTWGEDGPSVAIGVPEKPDRRVIGGDVYDLPPPGQTGAATMVFDGPNSETDQPSSVQEFLFAVENGFQGTFSDWLRDKGGSAKPSATAEKIDMLMGTGLDRETATNIATGRYVTSRDPVTQEAQIIDKATGQKVGSMPAGSLPAGGGAPGGVSAAPVGAGGPKPVLPGASAPTRAQQPSPDVASPSNSGGRPRHGRAVGGAASMTGPARQRALSRGRWSCHRTRWGSFPARSATSSASPRRSKPGRRSGRPTT